jgi:hypothetical protein
LSLITNRSRSMRGRHPAATTRRVLAPCVSGAAPYGYALAADGVALVEVAAEQAVIADARALHATGMSLRKISGAGPIPG